MALFLSINFSRAPSYDKIGRRRNKISKFESSYPDRGSRAQRTLHQRVTRRQPMLNEESSFRSGDRSAPETTPIESERSNGRASAQRSIGSAIGFVGLGHMGTAMAANLAAGGVQVNAYVRRAQQMGKLTALGLTPTTSIADLLDCEVVISMLPDDDAVREIVFGDETNGQEGLATGLKSGAIHLSMSTISTATASLLASRHAMSGQGYVAAPVFGNPDAAKARQLFIVAAGAPADVERCRPLLDSLGQRTFVIGDDPAQANLIKLLGNMMTATTLEMLGEAVAVVRKRGGDPKPFIDIMTSTMFGGRAHKIYGDKIVRQAYAPGFLMPLAFKDVRLALAEAERAGTPMPLVGVVRDRMISGIARGYGDLDWSALGLIAAEEAGLVSPANDVSPCATSQKS
jgi:3-hydroxyisobutyrate dehydrogenase-like beta-hydroxyacid dehydrogenase